MTTRKLTRAGLLTALLPGAILLLAGCPDPNSGQGGATTGGGTTGAGSSAKQDTSGDTIKIGHYASMSGDDSTFGQETDAGVKYAIEELNAAGGVDVGGKKMKVVLETQDDQSKADEAKTVAVKFSDDSKIVAVIGEVASGRSKVAAPVFQAAGIPMVSHSSTNPEVTKIGDYIFRVCFIDPFQGYVMAKFAFEEQKLKKVAVMRDPSNAYSMGLADVFKTEFTKMGGTVLADVSYNGKDSDFRSQLGQVKAAGVDGVFVPGYYTEVGTIAKQARELGISQPFLGGDGWDSSKLIVGAGGPGGALEGCFFSTHYSKDNTSPRVQGFVKAYQAKAGVAPAALVAQGYDAMMVIADAIKRAGSIERSKVREALAGTKDFDGVTGKITIDAERNASKPAVVLQVKGNDFAYAKTIDPK